ncbi:NmrA family protein [Catenulispora acidiphila DSM 44928]|uniref:NmrA family protein n=1 Tax=Catenulispora acidiphila (strain DSM 44928 / JCM 14897 / NBRC 102108 / NRRL B-24433 / ID139908) TaxID=479433 RepID=C7Q0G4_CATAD|nr:NAD(P)H-binding protein [Catenulispora acidiphila]ACU77497.1 NmrA family protein [Catenulispora acidiphila DSM 44928]
MKNYLILGGTGKTGRRIATRLAAAGHEVRTASRTGGDVQLDLDDPATHAPAFAGIDAAYLLEPGSVEGDNNPPRLAAVVDAAVDAGVRRLVLLSAPGADHDQHPLHATEQAVRGSGLEWTVVRPGWFAQNFSEDFWLPAVRSGTLALPAGEGRVPFVDAEDIADVAVAGLTEDRHAGEVYELTGPRAIGFGEAAELISAASGKPLQYLAVTPETFLEQQIARGVPRPAAERMTHLIGLGSTGALEGLTDGVERAVGRAPRRFEDFVVTAAATGCWS